MTGPGQDGVGQIAMGPVYRKITLRLIPFLMLLYLVAFLDRVNISFAALTMNRDLGIDERLFGLAAGIFFLGYFLFEIPSNLMLLRVGARRWIMGIMIGWGLLSVATAFVGNPSAYLALRFLLGIAESGFYPGVILYLTFWLPKSVRAGAMSMFAAAIPLSNMIGAPISAQILGLDHTGGLHGWQWLFLLEGSPAILLGVVVFFLLPDRPEDVAWLSPQEKLALDADLAPDRGRQTGSHSPLEALTALPVVYAWSFAYFCMTIGVYGLGFWIPKVLASYGLSLKNTGWAAALPYLAGIVAMLIWNRSSDRRQERRWHLVAAFTTAAIGFALAGLAGSVVWAVAGFSLAASGVLAAMPLIWGASTLRLAGPHLAALIAIINSIGNLGGFVGPYAMGWLRERTHSYVAGLLFLGCFQIFGVLLAAWLCRAAPKGRSAV